MKRLALPLLLLPVALAACIDALGDADREGIRAAQGLTQRAYQVTSAGQMSRAFDRGAFCALGAVLRRNDAGPIEDPAIPCAPVKP